MVLKFASFTAGAAALLLLATSACAAGRAPLYGFSNVTGLISIDPSTGKGTPIGAPPPGELQEQQLSCIDPKRNRLYMSGFRFGKVNVLGFDLTTGEVAVTIELPFASSGLVGVGTYIDVDATTGDLYATGPEWRVGEYGERHVVLRIDAATQTQTQVGVIPKGLEVLGGDSTFDCVNRVLWCFFGAPVKDRTGGIDLFAVHVDNGEVEVLRPSSTLTTLNYDASTQRIYGLGLRAGNATEPAYVRMLLFIAANDATRTVQLVGEQADYIGGDSSIATIDEGERLHMSYMQPQGETDPFNDPFYFVAIDADTGEVVDAQDAGTYFSLPWSLEAYN